MAPNSCCFGVPFSSQAASKDMSQAVGALERPLLKLVSAVTGSAAGSGASGAAAGLTSAALRLQMLGAWARPNGNKAATVWEGPLFRLHAKRFPTDWKTRGAKQCASRWKHDGLFHARFKVPPTNPSRTGPCHFGPQLRSTRSPSWPASKRTRLSPQLIVVETCYLFVQSGTV